MLKPVWLVLPSDDQFNEGNIEHSGSAMGSVEFLKLQSLLLHLPGDKRSIHDVCFLEKFEVHESRGELLMSHGMSHHHMACADDVSTCPRSLWGQMKTVFHVAFLMYLLGIWSQHHNERH